MKISKRVREEAAIACSIMACDRDSTGGIQIGFFEMPLSMAARKLAEAAFYAAPFHYTRVCQMEGPHYAAEYAEAEAMLRTGWSPP